MLLPPAPGSSTAAKRNAAGGTLLLLVLWAICFKSLGYYPGLPLRTDDTEYLIIAQNMIEGKGYVDAALPYRESILKVPTAFPAFISIYWMFLYPRINLLKTILSILLIIGALMSYLVIQAVFDRKIAFFSTCAFFAMPMFIEINNSVLSETLFIPLLYTGLFFLQKRGAEKNDKWDWLALLVFLICSRVRMLGIPFLGCYLLERLIKKDWIKVTVGIVALGGWLLIEQTMVVASQQRNYITVLSNRYSNNSDQTMVLASIIRQYIHNIRSFLETIYVNSLFPWIYGSVTMNPVKRLITTAVTLYGLFGIVILWKKVKWMRIFISGMALSLIPILGWPKTGTIYRYILPYVPVFTMGLYLPLEKISLSRKTAQLVSLSIALLLVVNQSAAALQTKGFSVNRNRVFAAKKVHDFINNAGDTPDIVISPHNWYTYLSTGIHSISPPVKKRSCESLAEFGNVWIITEKSTLRTHAEIPCSEFTLIPDYPPLFSHGTWSVHRTHKVITGVK